MAGPQTERASELAHHFAQALPTVEQEVAAHYAELAGRRAVELFSFAEAAEHFAFAADHTPRDRPDHHIDRLLAAGGAWRDGGCFDEAFAALDEAIGQALDLGDHRRAVQGAVAYADTSWRPGLPTFPTVEHLERALQITPDTEVAMRAQALAALGQARHFTGGGGDREADAATALATALGDPRLLGEVLWSQA